VSRGGRHRPSAILRAAGLDPDQVCWACGLAEADLVDVRAAPRWMERMWAGPVAAMTLPWGIYVQREVLDGDPGRLGPLLVHEMAHLGQWRRTGPLRFLGAYLAGYLSGRRRGMSHADAYRSIPFEVEARTIAGH
jgi:hypothetical protein